MSTAAFQDEIKEKIKKADDLSSKRPFPLSLFKCYDPYTAGELYQEAGDICRTLEDNLQAVHLYEKSFDTFLLQNDSSAKQCAAYVITKLAEVYASEKFYYPEKAISAYRKAALYHSLSGSFSIAASKTVSAAKLAVSQDDYETGELLFRESIDFYDKAAMPKNRILLLDDLLECFVKNGNFKKAGDLLVEMCDSRKCDGFLLVAWVSYYLAMEERQDIYDLLGKDSEIVDLLVRGDLVSFEDKIRGKLAKLTCKKIFSEIVDIATKPGSVKIDTR